MDPKRRQGRKATAKSIYWLIAIRRVSVLRWGTASSTAKMAVATHYPTAAV